MKTLLRYVGDGRFLCVTQPDIRAAEKFERGSHVMAELKEPRSLRQNAFLHAVFDQAWLNQRVERWENADHLKAAALCAIGHCDVIEWDKSKVHDLPLFLDFIAGLIARIRGKGTYPILTDTGTHLQIRIARRWRFSALSHESATKMMDPILSWLCSDNGPCPDTDPSELLRAAKREAA